MLISYWSSDVCSSDLHHEDQRLAGLDHATGAAVAIAKVRRDDELAAAADLHPLHTGVPARDDLADAEAELQRSAAVVGGIESLAAGVGDLTRDMSVKRVVVCVTLCGQLPLNKN